MMGDAPHLFEDRQSSILPDREAEAQQYEMEGGSSAGPGEQCNEPPFYSQLDAFPPISRSSLHANHYANYQHQSPMSRLDMKSVAAAMPDGSSPTSSRGFQQQTPFAYGAPSMNFQPQMVQYASQPYPPNMAMHASMPRMQHSQPYPPFYGAYAQPSQMSIPLQGQPMAAFPAIAGTPYSNHNLVGQRMTAQMYPGFVDRKDQAKISPSYPRGPPRKPKQSGHALWVGNLPPGTHIVALKDHFSRDATEDIESLFLISKSNCAFVNYRTEEACAAAMIRFHESRFQGVRLVCRLRRGTPTNVSSASVDHGTTQQQDAEKNMPRKDSPQKLPELPDPIIVASSTITESPKKKSQNEAQADGVEFDTSLATRIPDKFFIVKSLTLQDLESSVRNGIWATQAHNEAALDKAYQAADNVYLVFSANKSGEYFGYARMISPIASEPARISAKPQTEHKEVENGPKSIHTPATQWAPEGRILDDSARGTIFWEATRPDVHVNVEAQEEEEGSRQAQEWGKPFQIQWISTNRLPFHRTRGLRNPWNENREIKIARDGTEIEPSIGRRLVQMFHQPPQLPQGLAPPLPVIASETARLSK